ncbi:PREDICTED: RNA-binding protein 5 isoform X2 [Populus euphratica]|uniref:RNA-binding protein 5 isoform X2 n=1 Tax=Populus euphratica TaxID=75702 RepID=A0AAJ6SWU9_POPEU|nr:PREDICTED: RNA-binding protein 5 isoform X2 [Populus euphratica]
MNLANATKIMSLKSSILCGKITSLRRNNRKKLPVLSSRSKLKQIGVIKRMWLILRRQVVSVHWIYKKMVKRLLMMTEWDYDSTSGYYYNQSNGLHYDPNSGFYYSDAIGKWVTQEEAYAAVRISSGSKNKESSFKKPLPASAVSSVKENKVAAQSGPPPGPVVSASLNPRRSAKGAPSKIAVNKRKRPDEKPKAVSVEEKAALKAREAARKRVEEREKSLLGLYQH